MLFKLAKSLKCFTIPVAEDICVAFSAKSKRGQATVSRFHPKVYESTALGRLTKETGLSVDAKE